MLGWNAGTAFSSTFQIAFLAKHAEGAMNSISMKETGDRCPILIYSSPACRETQLADLWIAMQKKWLSGALNCRLTEASLFEPLVTLFPNSISPHPVVYGALT